MNTSKQVTVEAIKTLIELIKISRINTEIIEMAEEKVKELIRDL